MGISHQIMPACDQLCVCCPAMRTRSRQPVKRYKKLISDSFPRSPDGEPNDRMINKLCEYASKNPLRIPKITTVLEQRCYRELRNENLGSVKVVMCIYRKLLTTCKQQMPLFAGSFLSIIHILLDQMRHDEMRTVGCQALFDFIINQRDSTYMFNFEGLIPKICLLAQEMGEDERVIKMRCAGLQALSAMIWFMGEFCHMPAEFDSVTAVVLENCEGPKKKLDLNNDNQDKQTNGVQQNQMLSSSNELTRATSWRNVVTDRGLNVSVEDSRNPTFWSKVCLHNMAKLAKEATTVRRVLESLFRYFDNADLWSPEHGVALGVLLDMQSIMENSGQNIHFLLSTLIKHLDHKNVLKNPHMQIEIVEVASSLSKATKAQLSVTIVGAFSDMMRHLRKSIICSLDDSELGEANFRTLQILIQISIFIQIMSNLDVSLDDLIKRNKSSTSRNPRPRTTGSGSGSGFGPGPRRRFPNRAANRPGPYSVHAPESTWDHDMFAAHAPSSARGTGASGIETGIKLLISNLDYGVSNEDIKELFSEAGDIKRYSVHYDKSGRSKGTAEVIYSRRRDAEAAFKRYNNVQLDGKPMKIEFVGTNVAPPSLPPIRNRLYGNPNPAPRSQQRGGGFRRPRGGGRGSMRKDGGRGRGRDENISAEDLDAELEKYHAEAMQTN